MASRPCQPTNPPPKQYKPPILTKANPHSNLQQCNTQTKIASPYCRAGTDGYAASYRQISTSIGKPTMTLTTGTSHPTLQKNTVKYETKTVLNKISVTSNTTQPAPTNPCYVKPLPAVNHHLEATQMTIPSNSLFYDPASSRHTIKTDNKTRSTGTHPTHLPSHSLSPSRHPQCSIRNNHPINNTHPSSLHPSNSYTYRSPSHASTTLNPTCQCQSLDQADKLNNVNPSSTTTSTVTQTTALPTVTAIHPDPSTTPLLYHQSPPKPQNTQQNLGKVPTMPVWTTQNDHVLCTDTIHSNLPLECAAKPIFSTSPPSLMPCQLMQRLWKELTITQTLLDRLSNMILLEATSNQQSTPKNLFKLLTDLPQTNVTALGLLADIQRICKTLHVLVLASTTYMRSVLALTKIQGMHHNT